MTPDEPSAGKAWPDPAQERAVSDLLAGLRPKGAAPADVTARLDDVLAGLVAERAGDTEDAGRDEGAVDDLSQRRKPRWPAVLVAAAAVTVVGLGLGNVLESGVGGAGDESNAGVTSDEAAVDAGGGEAATGPQEADRRAAADAKASPGSPLAGSADPARRLQRLRSDSLALDVQRLAEFALVSDRGRPAPQVLARCAMPVAAANDEVLAVRFDGAPATLVIQAAKDGVRRADVYACDEGTDPLATTFVSIE